MFEPHIRVTLDCGHQVWLTEAEAARFLVVTCPTCHEDHERLDNQLGAKHGI